jgi:tetratricopeptide (TPR) repeat protein
MSSSDLEYDLRDARETDLINEVGATPAASPWPPVRHVEELLAAYDRARAERPTEATIHLTFGKAALAQAPKLDAEAVEALTRYVSLKAEDAQGHYYLGLAHAACGNYEDAAHAYLRALKLEQQDADILLALHFAYFSVHRFSEALKCIERVEQVMNSTEESVVDPRMCTCWQGVNRLLAGEDTAAEPLLRAGTESAGKTGEIAHYALTLLAIRRGDNQAAEFHRKELEHRESVLLAAATAARTRGQIEIGETVLALTGRPVDRTMRS